MTTQEPSSDPHDPVDAAAWVLIKHPSIPTSDGESSVCPSCGTESQIDGPNSPSHAMHQARALDAAGLLNIEPGSEFRVIVTSTMDRPTHVHVSRNGFPLVNGYIEPTPVRDARTRLAQRGRQLASTREDLIAQGIDPNELPMPLYPEPLPNVRGAKVKTLHDEATSLGYWLAEQLGEQVDDQDGETLTDTVQRLLRTAQTTLTPIENDQIGKLIHSAVYGHPDDRSRATDATLKIMEVIAAHAITEDRLINALVDVADYDETFAVLDAPKIITYLRTIAEGGS